VKVFIISKEEEKYIVSNFAVILTVHICVTILSSLPDCVELFFIIVAELNMKLQALRSHTALWQTLLSSLERLTCNYLQ
jgi:hypothetical protein